MEHRLRGGLEAPPGLPFGADQHGVLDEALARDSGDQIEPRYVYVPHQAGRLACGELVIEPALGVARVASVMPAETDGQGRSAFVKVAWRDDYGPGQAAGRYPADRLFPVRAPAIADRMRIRQGIDQARWKRREVSGQIARLIAAHLHLGPRSGLYGFAVNGLITDRLFDELDRVSTSREAYRPWASALARHCLNRDDLAPVPGWGLDQDEDELPAAAAEPPRRIRTKSRKPKRMTTETAQQLIDAAFALGVAASRNAVTAARARSVLELHTASGV